MWANDIKKVEKLYNILECTQEAYHRGNIENEIKVPDVADIVVLTYILKDDFSELNVFENYNRYWELAEKYHFVRNKLDNPGSINLEERDMMASVGFVLDISIKLNAIDKKLFWNKPNKLIQKEALALQTGKTEIPINYCNISEMPFGEKSIVCRNSEIKILKEFVYGKVGAIRKKSSFCIFGYGGVGKTALALEVVKEVIADIESGTTINNYSPEFILFYSAKEQILGLSRTSGAIEEVGIKRNFSSCEELRKRIFEDLKIHDFDKFHKQGLIIIDNLESLIEIEKDKIKEFIQYMSPVEVQFIITSRNEEKYEERFLLEGFENEVGKKFIKNYIEENNLDIELNNDEMDKVLDISRGNTLVLVLSLKRLSQRLATVNGIVADFSEMASLKKIQNEFQKLPSNGFEVVSEYMFKNTFDEIEKVFEKEAQLLYSVLKIFAVWTESDIDIYTVTLLLEKDYSKIEPVISVLCKYLILEKVGDAYCLNRFAAKYIIQRFLPDSEEYMQLANDIQRSISDNKRELKKLEDDMQNKRNVHNIFDDWCVESDGDKIAVAKAYKVYQDVDRDCKSDSKFFVRTALESAMKEINRLEQTTMHPYISFQKALILNQIERCRVLDEDFSESIIQAYRNTIWITRSNDLYIKVRSTKSFATVLWTFGLKLQEYKESESIVIRYLEDARNVFEKIQNEDKEYFQCLSKLGSEYFSYFEGNMGENYKYLDKAIEVSDILYEKKNRYQSDRSTKYYATILKTKVSKYRNR